MTEQLAMQRGVVTATKEQMRSVRVNRQTGYGRIRTTPELWLRDGYGKEHRYQGDIFGAARAGHEVAVISRPGSGKPVAFANVTTGQVYEGKELTISTSPGATLISTLGFSLLLALPGALLWAMLLGSIGLGDHAFSATGFQIFVAVLLTSVYVGVSNSSKRYRERSGALRNEIDRLLAEQLQRHEGQYGTSESTRRYVDG